MNKAGGIDSPTIPLRNGLNDMGSQVWTFRDNDLGDKVFLISEKVPFFYTKIVRIHSLMNENNQRYVDGSVGAYKITLLFKDSNDFK